MPELPEVETTAKGLDRALQGSRVVGIQFFRDDLRSPIPKAKLERILVGERIVRVFRRSKYILIETPKGFAIVHLGMTGNALLSLNPAPFHAHTHVIVAFETAKVSALYLHFVDPRRFGVWEAHEGADWQRHPLLVGLGAEPLEDPDLGELLWELSRKRTVPTKNLLMNAKLLVGVGNIYACEALFLARIHPLRPAGELSKKDCVKLAAAIQDVLSKAILQGGTTFRDFKNSDGELGYFAVNLKVYGRKDLPCLVCKTPIALIMHSGRSAWFCPNCQKK